MSKSESPSIKSLSALIAERKRHEGFLAKLEERRESSPEHVYERLRGEYLTKLTDLQERAAAEGDSIAAGLEGERLAIEEIDSELAKIEEERIEGQLRADVGEYDEGDWAKKLSALDSTIEKFRKERDDKSSSYEQSMELVREARSKVVAEEAVAGSEAAVPEPVPAPVVNPSPPPPPVQPAAPAASADPVAAAPVAAAPTAPRQPPTSSHPTSLEGSPSFDELAFLNSVVGRASSASAQSTAQPKAPSAPRAATPAAPPPAVVPPPPVAPPASVAPPAPPVPAAAEDDPPGPLGRPTPRASQAIKTLKCQECGTLNYPTEWYCERCGGELAAL